MSKRKKRTADFTPEGIESLAQDKPVVYKLLNGAGENVYTGVAKRGRVGGRLLEHIPGGKDPIPGVSKVKIDQKSSIQEAEQSEARIISRNKSKHNKRGK